MITETMIEQYKLECSLNHVEVKRRSRINASSTIKGKTQASISVKDLMGGEKNATEVRSTYQDLSNKSLSPKRNESIEINPELKIKHILEARKIKQERKESISKSLNSAMNSSSTNVTNITISKEGTEKVNENENRGDEIHQETGELTLKDEERPNREGGRPRRLYRSASPGRFRRRNVTREQRKSAIRSRSSLKQTEGERESPREQRDGLERTNSHGSLREKKDQYHVKNSLRRSNSQGSLRGAKDNNPERKASAFSNMDASRRDKKENMHKSLDRENSQGSLRMNSEHRTNESTAKVRSKATMGGEDGEEKIYRRTRSKSRHRHRSKSRTRDRSMRDEDADDQKQHSRRRSKSSSAVRDRSKEPSKRRSRSKQRATREDNKDESDHTSRKTNESSAPTRRGRRPGHKTKRDLDSESTVDSNEDDYNTSSHSSSSRRGRRPCKAQINRKTTKKTPLRQHSNCSTEIPVASPPHETTSLEDHLEKSSPREVHQNKEKRNGKDSLSIVSERSGESSKHSGVHAEQFMLQFDPTNESLVRTVRQEIIESEDSEIIHIGRLPPFEKQKSAKSLNGSFLTHTESTRSMLSTDGGFSEDDGPSSFVSMGSTIPYSSRSQLGTSQTTLENDSSAHKQRWPTRSMIGSNLQEKKSALLHRVQKGKAEVADRLMKNPKMQKAGMRLGLGSHHALEDDDDYSDNDKQSLLR